jgi:hypothetical protein
MPYQVYENIKHQIRGLDLDLYLFTVGSFCTLLSYAEDPRIKVVLSDLESADQDCRPILQSVDN